MLKPPNAGILLVLMLTAALQVVSMPRAVAAPLPNPVQFKVDEANRQLAAAETELNDRRPDMAREPLRVARARLDSIKEYQPETWEHPDVVAVRTRYDALEKRYTDALAGQTASAGKADEQLKRLEKFRQFGAEATYPEDLAASFATYTGAKALIDEIAAAGTDVQLSGYSDYSMTKLRVETWERNRDRVLQAFLDRAKEYTGRNVSREQEWLDRADARVADIAKVIPSGDSRVEECRAAVKTMQTSIRREQMEKAASVLMSPERYTGKDAVALRALAKKAVTTKFPQAQVLKVKLTGAAWGPPEGGLQWTDNTRSAVEVRTASYLKAEVAAKQGSDVHLHRVYLYKSKVNGQLQAAKSYVVGSQLMLEKNVK